MKLGCLLLCHWPKRREGKPCAASCPGICQSFFTYIIPGVKSRSTESSTSLSLAQTKSCSTKRFHGCHGWLRHLVRRLLRNLRLRHRHSHSHNPRSDGPPTSSTERPKTHQGMLNHI